MKSLIVVLSGLCFILSTSFTTKVDEGIFFEHGRYSEAKKLAKETDKTIFIDSYTQWCGPCKKMAAQVFTDSEVGAYFNQNFINVKMDMEKTEGILIARRYSVNFYPTLLFVKPNGELIRKEVGYQNKKQLLQLAKDVMN
ncbi:MAG: thioredoxin [Bacteroidetes bacterium]|nr:MAG: thioredoxin [Bacteroidota bacterium]